MRKVIQQQKDRNKTAQNTEINNKANKNKTEEIKIARQKK